MSVDLSKRLEAAAELVSENSLLDLTRLIWETDRAYTFPAFHATARHVSAKLREWGVRPRTFEIPADGKTILGDWKMPLGWDCGGATLEIYDPFEERGRVLADRKKVNTCVIMWSGPTPPEGITASVVRIADEKDLSARLNEVKGKIVYTPANPREFKKRLASAGALAVVTSWCRNAHLIPDATFWVNAWSDDPGGWAFHAGDAPLPGMVVSPQTGVDLDVLLDRGPVKLRMKIDAKYMETTMPVVCGYIDAPLQEEVLAIGHAMEQGANDNASACAVILESLRVLQDATQKGALAPLKRAVRGILTNECYGTVGFAALNPGILRRVQAGVNFDSLGRASESVDAKYKHHRCPDAGASVADTLMALLLEKALSKSNVYVKLYGDEPFALTDNHYNDPAIGVHCPYVDSQDRWWHTSMDTMDQISGRNLHVFATVSVAYLHFLATATLPEALWLAHRTVERFGVRLETIASAAAAGLEGCEDKALLLARVFDRLDYTKEIADRAIMSAKRFMLREERAQGHLALLKVQRHVRRLLDLQKRRLRELAGCDAGALPALTGYDDIAGLRPFKTFIGTPTYDSVPPAERASIPSPVWNAYLHCAVFWADGKHTFADIARRVRYEFDDEKDRTESLAAHFRFMGAHGLVAWLNPGDPIPKPPKPEKKSAAGEAHDDSPREDDHGGPADEPEAAAETPEEEANEADAH
ncbi:MAG: M28 family peptidase [Planctomycetota bacterium]|nr:M28 family peptidase [Planctomycetota bacterium]